MRPFISRIVPEDFWGDELINEALTEPSALAFLDFENNPEPLDRIFEEEWDKKPRRERRALPLSKFKAIMWQTVRTNPQAVKEIYVKIIQGAVQMFRAMEPMLVAEMPKIINETVGVLSLTETPREPLMWSHYADSHKGFVIEFDEKHSFFTEHRVENNVINGLHEIIYSSRRPAIQALTEIMKNSADEFGAKMFFTKSKQWVDEREWRMVLPLKLADKVIEKREGSIYLFALPHDCVTGVTLGTQYAPTTEDDVVKLIQSDERYKHVKLSRAIMSDKTYEMEIVPH